MDPHEEKELIAQAQKDPLAFAKVFDHYYPKIFGYTLRRTGDLAAAEDITSETFFKALKKLWQFRWRGISFSAWLYKIATNEIRQHFRKRGSLAGALVSLDELTEQGFEPSSPSSPEDELVEAQEMLERHGEFLACLEHIFALDEKYQEVVTLRFFEHKKLAEIAEILGKSEGTVKSLLHRALERLRIAMHDESITQPLSPARIVHSIRSSNNQLLTNTPEL